MQGFLAWTLILAALAWSGCTAQKRTHICDTCKCLPSALAEQARNIQCTCDAATRTITTTAENMQNLPHLESFTVVNCDSVSIQKDSFGNKHDLSNVILKRVKTASFALGVFAKLESLKIEDVDDLRLTAKAFLGAEIGEIAIRNSTVHEIPELALYNVHLRKLELTDVNIGTIKSNATLFVMGEQSSLIIEGCKVDRVETQGLELQAQKLRISGTTLTNLAPSSTIIHAAISLDIVASTFGKSDAEAMRISSNNINIFNNTFYNIPITIATAGEGGKVSIKNNMVHKLEFNPNVFSFLSSEFIRNSFLCNCQFAKDLEGVEELAAHFLPNFEEILTNNLCQSNCSKSLSVKDFFKQAKETCLTGEVDLCGADATGDALDPDASVVSGRSGRQDDHENHETTAATMTATKESALTAGHAKYGASSLLLAAFLATLLILS